MIKVSVIVPAYNEEATIVPLLERVGEQRVDGVEFEIVVVDDGSRDGTVALLRSRPELFTHLVARPRNGGKGAAVRSGLEVASGHYVVFQDADLEYDPAEYAELLVPVQRFGAEVVMGSRMLGGRYSRVHYFWNKVGNRFITLLFNVLFNTTFTDIYSCYLVFQRDLVQPGRLRTMGFQQHAEILCMCVRRARVLYEVPISYSGRTYEEGKKIRAHHIMGVITTIVRERLRW